MHFWYLKKDNLVTKDIRAMASKLRQGQVAIFPTDTIYGLSCLADHQSAIKKIYRLKKRRADKPLIILVSSLAMAKSFAKISRLQENYLKKFWSDKAAPTTVILESRGFLPSIIGQGRNTLALRLPKNSFLIKIIKELKKPIVSTSLNISGQDNLLDLKDLEFFWHKRSLRPDLVVDAGPSRRKKASRLIDLVSGQRPVILRK